MEVTEGSGGPSRIMKWIPAVSPSLSHITLARKPGMRDQEGQVETKESQLEAMEVESRGLHPLGNWV